MHRDEVKGKIKEGMGRAKDAFADLTDDEQLEAEGKAEQVEGKVQNTVGGLKDKARDLLDDK